MSVRTNANTGLRSLNVPVLSESILRLSKPQIIGSTMNINVHTFLIRTTLFSSVLITILFSQSSAQSCSSYPFTNNKLYTSCNPLPVLNSYLHWTYDSSSGTADIAFRATGVSTSNWIAWAINPTKTGMVGAQALVAYQNSSGVMHAYTSSVTSYTTTLAQSSLSFSVLDLSAEKRGSEMIIFGKVVLPDKKTSVNQVWQVGPLSGGSPAAHAVSGNNVKSAGTLDLQSGQTTSSAGAIGGSRRSKKNIHGVLNAVSWGILLPLGVIIARYMKIFKAADPAWFYLHIACQTSAYAVGVAGWATGLKLGNDSPGITYLTHRNIGIALFCLATVQVSALMMRPNKDHKYRFYWNMYHYAVGYVVIILSIVNVFKGFEILDPEKKWKIAYIGVIIFLGCFAVLLELVTWPFVLKRKADESVEKYYHDDTDGANGHGTRV